MIVDEYGSLEKSTDVANLLFDQFNIYMETNGCDASFLNGNNKQNERNIHNMFISGLIYSDGHENKWSCAADILAEFHRWKLHSSLDNTSTYFSWYGQNPSIHELKTFGCDIYPITSSPKILYDITQEG